VTYQDKIASKATNKAGEKRGDQNQIIGNNDVFLIQSNHDYIVIVRLGKKQREVTEKEPWVFVSIQTQMRK
jgi:hypothetical protein